MTIINRGFCFYCGKPVGPNDYDDVGPNRLWCCGAPACERELQQAQREAYQEAREEFEREWRDRW